MDHLFVNHTFTVSIAMILFFIICIITVQKIKGNQHHHPNVSLSEKEIKWTTYDPLGNVVFETTKKEFDEKEHLFRDIERRHYEKLAKEVDFDSLDPHVRQSLEATLEAFGIKYKESIGVQSSDKQ